MSGLLRGKTALVTGGSTGIGTAIVQAFIREDSNVVFTHYRDKTDADAIVTELSNGKGNIETFQADVEDFGRAQEIVDKTVENFGSIDILVNNAGANNDKVIWKMDEEVWDEIIATNLKGAFNYMRAASPVFREKKTGRIITISSINALRGKFGQANYAAAKAGTIGLSKSVAKELGRSNVTVNVVCPGLIATKMVQSMPEDFKQQAIAEIVLGQIGTPEDVAELIVFLASDKARHITGEVIKIDGGQYI
ncbi:MAG: SDR family oxidoreductase [Candidatus Marinimicrobia bacterium]|nr:SDR family oxidoreductase [Candidatus Neomarinimicrobiota bacterium]